MGKRFILMCLLWFVAVLSGFVVVMALFFAAILFTLSKSSHPDLLERSPVYPAAQELTGVALPDYAQYLFNDLNWSFIIEDYRVFSTSDDLEHVLAFYTPLPSDPTSAAQQKAFLSKQHYWLTWDDRKGSTTRAANMVFWLDPNDSTDAYNIHKYFPTVPLHHVVFILARGRMDGD